ncbi:MAG TPA: hypothetical protein VI894_03665 [Candidatus Nanoarchaeia archaeon]|nr:hypothetical protein [Candidatus Nanoarchaeia archaeon]
MDQTNTPHICDMVSQAETNSLCEKTMDDFWTEQGWYRHLPNGKKKLIRANWESGTEVRIFAIRFLVDEVLKKDTNAITKADFHNNRLGGLITNYYSNSAYDALKGAGYEVDYLKPKTCADKDKKVGKKPKKHGNEYVISRIMENIDGALSDYWQYY